MVNYLRIVSPQELEKILNTRKIPMSETSDWPPYGPNQVVFLFRRDDLKIGDIYWFADRYFEGDEQEEFVGVICFRAKLNNIEKDESAFCWHSVVHKGEVDLRDAASIKIFKIYPQQFK